MILRKLSRGRGLGLPVVRLICFRVRDDNGWFWPCAQSRNLWISFFIYNSRVLYVSNCFNLVPRALFPGFGGGAPKAREKRSGDEVAIVSAPYFLIFIFLVSWHTTSPWENSWANAKVDYITAAPSGPPDKSVSGSVSIKVFWAHFTNSG